MDGSHFDLSDYDHSHIAKTMLLKAVKVRADKGGRTDVLDIRTALRDLDDELTDGDWTSLIRRATWLVERAGRQG